MNTNPLIIIFLLVGVVLSGCLESSDNSTTPDKVTITTYLRDGGNAMHIFSDGTYLLEQPIDGTISGDYIKIEDRLYLKYVVLGTDKYLRMVWMDTCYVDHDGGRWF